MSRLPRGSPTSGTRGSAARSPTRSRCNAVVKAFGAEAREDVRLGRVLGKWRRRTNRVWLRATYNGTAQIIALVLFRAAIVGAALLLWWQGSATPGDVTYVLTTFFVIQGYLREVGMHIRNLQRSVNDMEELVDFHAEPLGVVDRADARPIEIVGGNVDLRPRDLPLRQSRDAALPGFLGRDRGGREGRTGRPLRLRQDDVRQADPAPLRRERRIRAHRRAERGACDAGVAPRADRDRPAGADPVPPLACGEHRLWPPGREACGDRARGEARQRARFHHAAAERLSDAGRRARRKALGRRASARGAGARVPRRRADPDPRRGDLEPRLGIRSS